MKKILAASALALSFTAATGANAAVIGIYGGNSNSDIASFLTANGHTVKQNQYSVSGANYTGLDTVILLRTSGDAATASFVKNGGRLITEWDAASWALGAGNLLNADDSYYGYLATNTEISFTQAGTAAGLGTGIGSSYSAGGASEFFRTFSNIGSGVEVWGTRPDGSASIIAGASGKGFVVVNGADWADSFAYAGAQNKQLLLTSLTADAVTSAVPEPATWAMMLIGFGGIGASMRRRKQVARVRFA
ncbi:PEPxxWA-CTERM sorting domain-containing protein [Sphingomonas floccifaciens]|uniref:PEPxxWA-CTERM sorting domain-containing protein n=1 Tax=Sphingomonas floccifaciens TaxID=1844115 RepID=A0ABW4N9G4_9SPHN